MNRVAKRKTGVTKQRRVRKRVGVKMQQKRVPPVTRADPHIPRSKNQLPQLTVCIIKMLVEKKSKERTTERSGGRAFRPAPADLPVYFTLLEESYTQCDGPPALCTPRSSTQARKRRPLSTPVVSRLSSEEQTQQRRAHLGGEERQSNREHPPWLAGQLVGIPVSKLITSSQIERASKLFMLLFL